MPATITRNRSNAPSTNVQPPETDKPFEVGQPNEGQNRGGASGDSLTDTDQLNGLVFDLDLPPLTRQGAGREPNPMDPTVVKNLDAMLAGKAKWAIMPTTNYGRKSVLTSTANKWAKAHESEGAKVRYIAVTPDMYNLDNPTGKAIRAAVDAKVAEYNQAHPDSPLTARAWLGKFSPDKTENDTRVTVIYHVEKVSAQ